MEAKENSISIDLNKSINTEKKSKNNNVNPTHRSANSLINNTNITNDSSRNFSTISNNQYNKIKKRKRSMRQLTSSNDNIKNNNLLSSKKNKIKVGIPFRKEKNESNKESNSNDTKKPKMNSINPSIYRLKFRNSNSYFSRHNSLNHSYSKKNSIRKMDNFYPLDNSINKLNKSMNLIKNGNEKNEESFSGKNLNTLTNEGFHKKINIINKNNNEIKNKGKSINLINTNNLNVVKVSWNKENKNEKKINENKKNSGQKNLNLSSSINTNQKNTPNKNLNKKNTKKNTNKKNAATLEANRFQHFSPLLNRPPPKKKQSIKLNNIKENLNKKDNEIINLEEIQQTNKNDDSKILKTSNKNNEEYHSNKVNAKGNSNNHKQNNNNNKLNEANKNINNIKAYNTILNEKTKNLNNNIKAYNTIINETTKNTNNNIKVHNAILNETTKNTNNNSKPFNTILNETMKTMNISKAYNSMLNETVKNINNVKAYNNMLAEAMKNMNTNKNKLPPIPITGLKTNNKKSNDKNNNAYNNLNPVFVNNVDIPSVLINNLRLTEKIQENLNDLIDNCHCVYCLKRVNQPITLTACNHELCLECAKEIISLYKFIHVVDVGKPFIKCPKCSKKSDIPNNDLNSMLRLDWKPRPPIEQTFEIKKYSDIPKNENKKLQLCEICPNSKYIRDLAEFECLNCDIIMCYECRIRHLANPRHQDHKVIPYTKIAQEKVELTLCDKHRETLKLFCETCLQPVCIVCAQYDKGHENHKISTIKNIMENYAIELTANMRKYEGHIKIIEELIGSMVYSKKKLEEERNDFFVKLKNTIDEIKNILEKKEKELKQYIDNLFKDKLEVLENKLINFQYIKNRYDYYHNLICDRDIDIIDRVDQIKKLNKKVVKIEKLGLLDSSNFNKSFAQSIFINFPNKDITKSLQKYSFLPITDITTKNLSNIFKNSLIIKQEMLLRDFIIILPKIKSGILLYSTAKDGVSPVVFHQKCDNKGPTITIVKTSDGHVFGGYMPRSWVSESMYNECEDSFIFSLSDGQNIKPVKCPLKIYKKSTAIYQNEENNSPGWGEVSEADLFISYKNLSNSYSNLGNCYKAPKNVQPDHFLAGKPTKWDIELVEVYAIEVVSEEEYYKMMLN